MCVCGVSPLLTGEVVSPEECFTVTEYPPFLPPLSDDLPPHPSTSSHPHPLTTTTTTTDTQQPSENNVPSTTEDRQIFSGKKPSAFTPVDTNRVSYVTPDLFGDAPAVGKAVASSTPVPRALAFTRVCDSGTGEGGGVVGVVSRNVSGVVGGVDSGSVRMALDFGSAVRSAGGDGGGGGGESRGGTPVFGVLSLPPSSSYVTQQSSVTSASTAISTAGLVTPSHITPSPTALPAHYTRQLLTAPTAPKKRVSVSV